MSNHKLSLRVIRRAVFSFVTARLQTSIFDLAVSLIWTKHSSPSSQSANRLHLASQSFYYNLMNLIMEADSTETQCLHFESIDYGLLSEFFRQTEEQTDAFHWKSFDQCVRPLIHFVDLLTKHWRLLLRNVGFWNHIKVSKTVQMPKQMFIWLLSIGTFGQFIIKCFRSKQFQ